MCVKKNVRYNIRMTHKQIIGYGMTAELIDQLGPEPAAAVARVRASGLDGVFLKVLDPVTVAACKDAGLAVYASQAVFLADDELWARFPRSRPLTARGAPAPVEEWYHPALPADADFRAMRLAQVEATVARWPLDGLWLDFIRWPARWEKRTPSLYHSSFDPVTLARFAADTGVALPETGSGVAAWILDRVADVWWNWRCRQIADFVADVAALRDRTRPEMQLGLFTIPWTGTNLDALAVAQANIRIVAQDPVLLQQHADVLSPMVYHRLCDRAADWPAAVTAHVARQVDAAVWPVIELLADDDDYAPAEFAAVLAACREAGSGPVIVFNLAGWLRWRV